MHKMILTLAAAAAVSSPSFAGEVSAGKLAKDAEKFYGQTVTVKAEVEDVIGPRSFTLDEDAILAGADVLVLVPAGLKATLTHDQKVVVTGKVRRYVVAELDRDFDFFEGGKIFRTEKKVDLDTRPVVVATSVTTESGLDLLTAK
jgi:hypothetical protein